MMLYTQFPLVLKLIMRSDMPSNLTICLLGAYRNNFTLILSIFTNTSNYNSNKKSSHKEDFQFYSKLQSVAIAVMKFLVSYNVDSFAQ
jgi:hypothetical protein